MRKSPNAQTAPLDEAARLSWKAFFVASQLLVEQVEKTFHERRLGTLSQYDALYTLAQAGEEGMTIRQLGGSLTLSQSGLSRLIDRLEELGYVKRLQDAKDKRAVRLCVLPLGRTYLDDAWDAYAEVVRSRFEAVLTPQDMEELHRVCLKLAGPLIQTRERTTRTRFVHALDK